MQVKVRVKYFAMLKELAGSSQTEVEIDQGMTASALYMKLAETHGFPLGLSDIRVAVNDEFTTSDHPLSSGDQVVFIPPVAGG